MAASLGACEHGDSLVDGGDDQGLQPTLESIQTNIFNTNCALSGCHVGSNAPQGLDLSEGNARDNLVNVPSGEVPDLLRVDPGNADDSYLIIKLEGGERMIGARMPFQRPALSSETIGVIRQWINEGAQ